jgi:hypothetical protein
MITSFIFKSIKVRSLNIPQVAWFKAEHNRTDLIYGRQHLLQPFSLSVGWLNLKTEREE